MNTHPYFLEQMARQRQREIAQQRLVAIPAVARPGPRLAVRVAAGRWLVRVGGHLVTGRRPERAPCPWCDGAFPA